MPDLHVVDFAPDKVPLILEPFRQHILFSYVTRWWVKSRMLPTSLASLLFIRLGLILSER